MSLVEFISNLRQYILERAEQKLPLSQGFTQEDKNAPIIYNSIYDEACVGLCPDKPYQNSSLAREAIKYIKLLFFFSEEEYELLGCSYEDYCWAVCTCLSRVDYRHMSYQYDSNINYDFYRTCASEGIEYNRWYFLERASPDFGLYYLGHDLFKDDSLLKYVFDNCRRTDKKLGNYLLRLNGNAVLVNTDFSEESNLDEMKMVRNFDVFINSSEFINEIAPKLPDYILQVFKNKVFRLDGDKTWFAFYIQAIKHRYETIYKSRYGFKITDKMFETVLGCKKIFSSLRDSRMKGINITELEDDPKFIEIIERFPEYKSRLTRSSQKLRTIY